MKPCFSLSIAALATAAAGQKNFMFFGTNEAGAEFGATVPGIADEDFTFPNKSAISVLMGRGMSTFRIPFLMERLAPNGLGEPFDEAYLVELEEVANHITIESRRDDTFAVLDSHNYARYDGEVIRDLDAFATYHRRLAERFVDNPQVVFDCNNEPYELGEDENTLVRDLMQACINGVREGGAIEHYIFVEGTSWSGAHSWVESGNAETMGDLEDPSNNPNNTPAGTTTTRRNDTRKGGRIVYEMHQYLDEDSSGTHEECVSATIGAERLEEATEWLRENGKVAVLGEYAGGNNDVCKEAVRNLQEFLVENRDVWLGSLWWAAGPFWGDYLFSMEPGTGIAFDNYLDSLTSFA